MSRPIGPPVCNFWVRFGNCKFGDTCKFAHPQPDEDGGLDAGPRPEQHTGRGRGPPGGRGPPRHLPLKPSEPAYLTRKWWTSGAIAPGGPRFRVMTYNVLADELAQTHRWELYRGTPLDMLQWPRRWALIKAELEFFTPDIVCLQEVDHWDEMYRDMAALEFQGTYAQRSGGRTDGCATFWRSARFEQVASSQLKFSDFDLRDNVGMLTLLCHKEQGHDQVSRFEELRRKRMLEQQQHRRARERERQWQQLKRQQKKGEEAESSSAESSSSSDDDEAPRTRRGSGSAAAAASMPHIGPHIAVANTHVLFNPKRGDVKIAQQRLLIKHLQALVSATLPPEQVQHVSALIMGDMNHQPGTPLYTFMRDGWVDCLQQHRKVMAGTQLGLCSNPLAQRQQRQMMGRGPGSFQQQQQHFAAGQHQQFGMHKGPSSYMQQQQHHMLGSGMVPPGMPLLPPGPQQQYGQSALLQQQYYEWDPAGGQQQMQPQHDPYGGAMGHHRMQVEAAGVLHRSASAPAVLTLRKVKNAGWSAEELVTATGGAAGTHLKHYIELEQQELHKQKKQEPQQQLKHQASAPTLGEVAAVAYDAGLDVQPAWQQQQQGMHMHGVAATYDPMQDLGMGFGGNAFEGNWADMAGGVEMEIDGDYERQRQLQQQGSSARELSPETKRLKEQHQKAVKAQMKQHARAREALLLQHGSRGALENLQLQQKKEASTLKRQHQQQLLQRQFDKAAQQLRLQQQLQGLDSASCSKQEGSNPTPDPPSPPAAQQQQQDAAVPPPPPPQQQQQDLSPPPPPAPVQQQEDLSPPPQPALAQQQQQQDDAPEPEATPSGPLFSLQHSKYWPKHLWDEPLPAAMGDGIARHGLQLCSCYEQLTGCEPEFTSCHDSFYGTVDYIWYTPETGRQQLQPVAVLLPPDVEEHLMWMRKPCLPNTTIPSDHISLVCDLELRRIDV